MFDNDERFHLINADCMTILPQLVGKNIGCIVTDFPYNVVNRESAGLRNLDKGEADDSPIDISRLAQLFSEIAKSVYVFCSSEQVSDLRSNLVRNKMSTRHMIWKKTNCSPVNCQYTYLSSIENIIYGRKPKAVFHGFYEHPVFEGPTEKVPQFPTPKPVWLCKKLIDMSTNIGDIILDPFMGSGSIGVAALQLGRRFVGIEKNVEFFELAKKRIQDSL